MKYYLVGIKGTGMSSLAIMLKQRGHEVLGSDIDKYIYTQDNLLNNHIRVLTYNINNLKEDYFYIIQGENNSLEAEYIKKHYAWLYYTDFIARLSFYKIAVSGTHGKTTVTSILSHIFKEANYIIGNSCGHGNSNSNLLIFESCEYKDHFLKYSPDIGIILNVEMDHVDYFKDYKSLKESFIKFSNNSKLCIYNGDNIKTNGISFGYNKDNDYIIKDNLIIHNNKIHEINYTPLSKGMMYDFCAAYIVCDILKKPFDISNFKMPKKRFNEFIYKNNYIIDDYAHHPSELKNVIELINNKYKQDPIIIFEPHQFERLKYFKNDFYNILSHYESYIMPLYNARSKVAHDAEFFIKEPLKKIEYFNINNYKNQVILFASASKTFKDVFF